MENGPIRFQVLDDDRWQAIYLVEEARDVNKADVLNAYNELTAKINNIDIEINGLEAKREEYEDKVKIFADVVPEEEEDNYEEE